VAASPVDPQATKKSMPDSICQFTSAASAGSSIDPSARKGVTIAVPQPVVSIKEKFITKGLRRAFDNAQREIAGHKINPRDPDMPSKQ
jgi:hypothetical protein